MKLPLSGSNLVGDVLSTGPLMLAVFALEGIEELGLLSG